MEKPTLFIIYIIMFILILIGAFFYIQLLKDYSRSVALNNNYSTTLNNLYKEYENNCESCKLCGLNYTRGDFGIRGIIINHSYYAVWIKNWNLSDVVYSQTHELVHQMVYQNPEHFCGSYGYNQTD